MSSRDDPSGDDRSGDIGEKKATLCAACSVRQGPHKQKPPANLRAAIRAG